jgi:hypothetical protein
VYDSLQSKVAELSEAFLQGLRDPKECRVTLLLLEIPRYATYSTAPHVLHSLLDPPALRDARGSTSPWEHEGTLSVRTFQRQTERSGLPLTINNAVGSNLVSPQELLHSRAEAISDHPAPLPANPTRTATLQSLTSTPGPLDTNCTCIFSEQYSISLDAHGKLPCTEPPSTAQHKVGARKDRTSCPTVRFSISTLDSS